MITAIFGATSGIAKEIACELAKRNHGLVLVARDSNKLETIATHISAINPKIKIVTIIWDLSESKSLDLLISKILSEVPDIDVALLAYGILGDQSKACSETKELLNLIETNYTSACVLLMHLANYFESRKSGTIATITSVAGDRGRQSNYAYGSTKAGLSAYLQGLRNKLYSKNITVLDIKPGFVDTQMTRHLSKNLLFADPKDVAISIVKAIQAKKDYLYTPWYWKYIMLVIKNIPEFLFKRTKT